MPRTNGASGRTWVTRASGSRAVWARARPRPILAAYAEILADLRFVSGSLVIGGAVGILYTLASVLPFVLIDRVGLTPLQSGLITFVSAAEAAPLKGKTLALIVVSDQGSTEANWQMK